MMGYLCKGLLVLGVCWVLVSGSDDFSNVMKVSQEAGYRKEHPKSLLKYNAEQAPKNNTDEDYLAYDLQILVEAVATLNFSKCGQDAMVVLAAMTKRERWAIQMFDSSAKFPVGLLYGNFYQMGNFDECIGVKQPFADPEGGTIKGQYCLADVDLFHKQKTDGRITRSSYTKKEKFRHVFNNTMYWGICVPDSCTVGEIETVVKEIFSLATTNKKISVRLKPDRCQVKKSEPFSSLEIIYGCVVGLFGVFVLLATVFHYYVLQQKKSSVGEENQPRKSILKEIILCFSVIRTVGKFLATSSSDLNCICGIKFLSMMFIITGHTFLFIVGGPVQNTNFFEKESQNLENAIFVNSPLLVDTFLLVGGFLLCYLLLIELDKRKGKINVFILYVGRYIRLTPSYLVVLGFYCFCLYRIGDGPLWDSRIKVEQERCYKSWWTNLLYLNNYINTDHMCMFQSWYLAADYHLFIISPIFIYPLWKFNRIGKNFLAVGILIAVVTPFIITLTKKLDPTLMIYAPEVYDISENFYFKNVYIKTHMRGGSYFLGLLFGYVLYKLQTKGNKISKFVLWFGWMLATICGIISMYSVVIFYYPDHEYNALEAAVYASLHRVAWCISIGWIMIVCITKNASLINNFLSWKPFIPLSRLTYCAYLINGFLELYSLGTIRNGIYLNKFEMATKSLAHTIITFAFAFILCIFFESPIHGLEKIILLQHDKNSKQRSAGDNNEVDDATSV